MKKDAGVELSEQRIEELRESNRLPGGWFEGFDSNTYYLFLILTLFWKWDVIYIF